MRRSSTSTFGRAGTSSVIGGAPGSSRLLGGKRAQQGLQVDGRAVELELVALEPRDVDHLVHQRAEPVHGVPDPLEMVPARRRVEAQVEKALRVAADEGERRPQLVRDRGHEAGLERIERPRPAQVAQDRDRARPRARHPRVARGDRDRHPVRAGHDLLADKRPPMGQDFSEGAGASAAATAACLRQAAQERLAGRPDALALGRADEPAPPHR